MNDTHDAMAPVAVPPEFAQALRELGLAGNETLTGMPLSGGVSSDIWRIETAAGPLCAKRALSRLRVAADWRAPIERSRSARHSLSKRWNPISLLEPAPPAADDIELSAAIEEVCASRSSSCTWWCDVSSG